jgi:Family of unknown function (DUF6152)
MKPATLVITLFTVVAPAYAHHSFTSQYDKSKSVTLHGVVTKVEWMNPHARFYVDVADAQGQVVNWNLELASPNVLRRVGWGKDSVKAGDEVVVEGSLAKDGSHMANALIVTLADGRRVFARENADEAP